MDQGAKTRLGLDNAVGDVHLAANRRQPEDKLRAVKVGVGLGSVQLTPENQQTRVGSSLSVQQLDGQEGSQALCN